MKPAIEVRGLGKRYELGLTHTDLLSEKLGNGLRSLAKRLRLQTQGGQVTTQAGQARGDSFWALKDIDFEVQPGEVMGIIGRNGAGKSTLLKILSRITSPTTGEVRLNGRVASLLEVGTGFHPELTGRENIYLNGAILGMARQEISRKFDEIVAFAEVEKFIDTPVKRYSSGMYVRLAFAVAAHLEPEILVVDEVLAVGDLGFQKKCLSKMDSVAGEGRTIVFVSHNMESIKRLCQRVIWLDEGRKRKDDTAVDCVTDYQLQNVHQGDLNSQNFPYYFLDQFPVVVHSFSMFTKQYEGVNEFSSSAEIQFRLDWENLARIFKLRVGFVIQTSAGSDLLTALDGQPEEDGWISPGRRYSICKLPANVLNEGEFLVELCADAVRFGENHESLHLSESRRGPIARFHVVDGGVMPGKYYGVDGVKDSVWPGSIMLPIVWTRSEAPGDGDI